MHSAFKQRPKKPAQPPKSTQHHPKAKSHRKKTSHPANKTAKKPASSAPARLWLRDLVKDEALAREVQAALGEELAEKFARQLKKQKAVEETPIYVVTPTYRRPEQQAELTRLAQTLMHVPNMYWLLVEDSKEKTTLVTNMVQRWDIRIIHLNCETSFRTKPW